jgi:hypothetical protein
MALRLVPPTEPTPTERVRRRLRAMPKADGTLQCNRCGSRTVLNTENGVTVKNGRRQPGTKIDIDVCADCYKRGIYSPMIPTLKRID